MVDQGRVGSAPVDRADSDVVVGKLLEEGCALGLVTGKDCLVDVRRERVGGVARLGSCDDLLIRGCSLLQRENADVATKTADEGVGARLRRVVEGALLGVVGGVGEEGAVVGNSVFGDLM